MKYFETAETYNSIVTILIRAFFEIADTDADMKSFHTADMDADTDMENFQTADADTDIDFFRPRTRMRTRHDFFKKSRTRT